jgi:hypothetical protein
MSDTISQPAGAAQAFYVVGIGAMADFPVPFQFDEPADLKVFINGTLTTAYTLVNTATLDGIYTRATVRLNAPITSSVVAINRDTALAQGAVFPKTGNFNVAALNREFARLWAALQDHDRTLRTTLRGQAHEDVLAELPDQADRAGYLLGFGPDGGWYLTTVAVNGAPLTATGQLLAYAVDAAAARAAIAAAAANAPSFTGGIAVTGGAVIDNLKPASVHGGPLAGLRNRIINGAMMVDQRQAGVPVVISPPGGYSIDRWFVGCAGGNVTAERVQNSTGRFQLKLTGSASLAMARVVQRIESRSIADLAGKKVTISWDQFATFSGMMLLVLRYPTTQDNFAATTEIVQHTGIPIGPITGRIIRAGITLPAEAAYGLEVHLEYPGFLALQHLTVGEVQLEEGETATPFERRPQGLEETLCRRYFESGQFAMEAQAAGRWAHTVSFSQNKRIVPAMAIATTSSQALSSSEQTPLALGNGFRSRATLSGAGWHEFIWAADAEL